MASTTEAGRGAAATMGVSLATRVAGIMVSQTVRMAEMPTTNARVPLAVFSRGGRMDVISFTTARLTNYSTVN